MQYRKISGKAVSHLRRDIRRVRAQARAASTKHESQTLHAHADEMEAALRTPRGGRRHDPMKVRKS